MSTTLAQMTVGNPASNVGTSGTIRYYSNVDFTALDGTKYKAGSLDSKDYFLTNTWSVSGGDLIVPAITFPTTTDGQPGTARIQAGIYDSRGIRHGLLFDNYQIPANPSGPLTMLYLETLKHLPSPVRHPETLSKADFALMLQQAVDTALGTLNYATTTLAGRAKASVNPTIAANVTFIEASDPLVPAYLLHTSKYASLNAAITAIGLLGGGTIVVDSATPVASNVTIPATVAVRVEGQGILTGSSTVTILGPLSAEPRQIFASGITTSFTGNSVLKDFHIAWWGADSAAAGAATSAALNAAFIAWPNGATMHLSHRDYTHAGITIDRKFNVTLLGSDSLDGFNNGTEGPRFIYNGVDGGDGITIFNCYASTFRGFSSYGAATLGAAGPARNIYVTMVNSGYPPISSQNVFQSLFVVANTTRAAYKGLTIENASGANNEFHQIKDCKLYGGGGAYPNQSGTGIFLDHINVKQIRISNTSLTGFDKAIELAGGSFRGVNNTFTSNSVIAYGIVSDAITMIGDDGEDNTQYLDLIGSGFTPVTIIGGRVNSLRGGQTATANTTTAPVFNVRNAIRLSVIGCSLQGYSELWVATFIRDQAGASSVLWDQNTVGTGGGTITQPLLDAGLNTFRTGQAADSFGFRLVGSHSDVLNNRSLTLDGSMSTGAPRPLIGIVNNLPVMGTGEVTLSGLAAISDLSYSVIGTGGATTHVFAVMAKDVAGNRTLASNEIVVTTSNATLSASNLIRLTWTQSPNATNYDIVERSLSPGGTRLVASVGAVGTYDIIVNPAAALTYTVPTFNETGGIKLTGAESFIVERSFTSLDTTPSVIGASDFVTANAGATLISTFDDPVVGQILRVRVGDVNTTFVNGSGILTRTGANVVATNGLIYQFIRRGSNWYQL